MPLFQAAGATRALIAPDVDTKNFKINKSARFGNRFFQMIVSLAAWFFLGRQNPAVVATFSLSSILWLNWILAVVSPALSAACIGIYMLPWFKKSWNSRKMLMTESVIDATVFILWVLVFSSEASAVGGNCPPGQVGCDLLNWVLAWGALSMIFWFVALALDVYAFLNGVYGWGDRLSDGEADSVLRRLSKGSRARHF